MKKLLLLIIVGLALTGVASAIDVSWDALDDGTPPLDEANAADAVNWTDDALPTGADKVKFWMTGAAICIVDSPVVWGQLVQGDNGAAVTPEENYIIIRDGGYIDGGAYSSWHAIGYNRPAKMVIERGGTWSAGDNHLWLGFNSGADGCVLEVNGGTLTNDAAIQLGRGGGGIDIYLNAGLIDVTRFAGDLIDTADTSGSSFDIGFGTFRINRTNLDASIQGQINAGLITAFGEQGDDGVGAEIVYDEPGDGHTYLTAIGDPLQRDPTYDGYGDRAGDTVDLSWVNLDSIPGGNDVWVDVYFGTDITQDANGVYADFNLVADAEKNLTTKNVPTPDEGAEYIWRVDTYLTGDPAVFDYVNDPNDERTKDTGLTMYFKAISDFPVESAVIDTPPYVTWKNEPIAMQATIDDDSQSDVTVTWTADDPNAVFSTPVTVIPSGSTYPFVVTTDVTVDYHAAQFVVTVTAEDESIVVAPATDTVQHDCADNPCQATTAVLGLDDDHPGDVALDCVIDLGDIVELALDWTTQYALPEPTPIP